MSLKFHGIEVNQHAHPGEAVVRELENKTIYQLNEILDTNEEIEKIQWIISFNRGYSLNFDWADGVVKLAPDGEIAHETI